MLHKLYGLGLITTIIFWWYLGNNLSFWWTILFFLISPGIIYAIALILILNITISILPIIGLIWLFLGKEKAKKVSTPIFRAFK